ncbi:MAG: acyltransferase [Chitinophagaceae bacterium]|nr:acyltransferase [Chitinophagaceae bacterium]MBP6047566.1 acyltransferase [Ferruginibacter sp.]NMD28182.1 acyltransferase [Bacteroidota bacterium]MBK7087829.1 acyltransferase [Chitinophagaceae bacterium]MBK8774857.1 acyltransferase [Chitinophagaceae bacterium]
MDRERVFGLDIFRAFAILCVMVAHTNSYYLLRNTARVTTQLFAFIGVETFFVLSGFLIGGILLKLFSGDVKNLSLAVKNFWVRRWFRTLPNYFLMLLVYIILEAIMGGVLKPYYLLFTVFLQNTFRPHPTFFGPAWSLSIEEWFYLLFPLGLAFAIRWLKLRGEKLFAFVVLLFIGSCLLLRIVVAFTANPEWLIGFRTIMPLRLDSIAFGVGFALLKYYHPGFFKKYRFLFFASGVAGTLIMLFVFYFGYLQQYGLKGGFFLKTFFFSFYSLFAAMLLPLCDAITTTTNRIWQKIITHISLISYSLYLVHWVFVLLVNKYGASFSGWERILMVWVASLVTATLQYKYFEKPMTDMREKFSFGKKKIQIA